jgi:hypothetical protein
VRDGFFGPAGEETRQRKRQRRVVDERLQRAQLQCFLGMLDGGVIGTANTSRQGIEGKNRGGVGIDHHGAVDGREREIVVARQAGVHRASQRERERCVGASVDRGPRQPSCSLPVLGLRARPIHQMALLVAPCGERIGHREVRIRLQRLAQQPQRLRVVFRGLGEGRRKGPQGEVVGVLVCLGLAPRALDLGLAQHRRDRADHAFGDPVLQIERVFEGAVEAVGPQVLAACRLDELAGDAHPVARLAKAALDHIPHAELTRDLLRIRTLSLVAEAGVAGDDREPPRTRQFGDQILGHAVEKELGLGIAAEVLKRQHGERRPVDRRGGSAAAGARRARRSFFQHDAEDAHRAVDVLDLVLATILEHDR